MTLAAAYLAGLFTTPAAYLGVVAGLRWWARLRRSEARSEAEWPEREVTDVTFEQRPRCGYCDWCRMGGMFCRAQQPPPAPPAQDDITVSRVRFSGKPSRVHHRRNGR